MSATHTGNNQVSGKSQKALINRGTDDKDCRIFNRGGKVSINSLAIMQATELNLVSPFFVFQMARVQSAHRRKQTVTQVNGVR